MAAISSTNVRLDIFNETYSSFYDVQFFEGISANPSGTTTGLGKITAISLGGVSTAEIDTTALASTTKSAIMGTLDGGTIDVSFIAKTDQSIGLGFYKPTAGSNTPWGWRIAIINGGLDAWYFNFIAYIQSTNLEAAVDSAVTGTMTLRITGAVSIVTV